MRIETQSHPYSPVFSKNTTALIIGTTPPARFCNPNEPFKEDDVNFYYGSRDNLFWIILGEITKTDFAFNSSKQAIKQRKDFLQKRNIGIVDILGKFQRIDNSASDNALEAVEYQDILGILNNSPSIENIFLTGKKTESFMSRYLGENKIYNTIISKKVPVQKQFKLSDRRNIISYTLFSPSPKTLRRKTDDDILDQYKKYLPL